ncbi:alcohol dehydrogenase catalytic domain-containing protein [Microbacterium sp. YY-01]|uniref:alcohol dehydrogenase catalytic domain-containing protein n=1 Tax=Microbacterium sp. YY-01 TaxID=3421634 RepID=UPI003D1734AC
MKQFILEAPGRLVERDVPIPELAAGDVLLKTAALTLCGSDVRIYTGEKTGGVEWPVVIGHEFTGHVVEVGGSEESHLIGKFFSVVPWIVCRKCTACLNGQTNLCPNVKIFGYQLPGAMSEFVRIPKEAVANGNLIELPENLPPEVGALSEPLSCVFHGHLRCNIKVGETVLILGGGPIGLLHTKLALRAGAGQVIVSEPDPARATTLRQAGASSVINPLETDVAAFVQEATNNEGADVSIICIGRTELANEAIYSTRPGGVINLFAGFGHAGIGELDLNAIHYNQLDVIGNADATLGEFRTAARLIANGEVEVVSMLTHRYSLSDAQAAIDMAASGKGIKVAVLPDSEF